MVVTTTTTDKVAARKERLKDTTVPPAATARTHIMRIIRTQRRMVGRMWSEALNTT